MTRECQVAIVGAGPVGLFLSLLLHQNGVKVLLIERHRALYPLPRAVCFDHESRRLMGILGLDKELDKVLVDTSGERSIKGEGYCWRDKELKTILNLDWGNRKSRSGLPFVMAFCQPELEEVLNKAVEERGVPIIRGWELTELQQGPSGVDSKYVPFFLPGTEKDYPDYDTLKEQVMEVKSDFIVGCDGANSAVRSLSNIDNVSLPFESDWLIADILLKNGYIPPLIEKVGSAQICDPSRPATSVFPGRGRRRMEFMCLPKDDRDSMLSDTTIYDLLKPWGFTRDNCLLERRAVYTFKARWAREFHRDRVLLAGDAMHLMPPFLGQGLNSGFRDAAALAWRLPLALKGESLGGKLWSSYQNERLFHVRTITEYAIALGEVICELDEQKSQFIHKQLRENPPTDGMDPPLGRPGILTDQPAAGKLSLQRTIVPKSGGSPVLFDQVYGHGWMLINMTEPKLEEQLSPEERAFFVDELKGKCVFVSEQEDHQGEYKTWFETDMTPGDVVLVRPDFYVYGHAAVGHVNDLIQGLKSKV